MSIQSKFIKDSYWAVGAQAVSLLTSVVVSFVLPKFISVADFGYWQNGAGPRMISQGIL